jgi:hypothetical protein
VRGMEKAQAGQAFFGKDLVFKHGAYYTQRGRESYRNLVYA